MISIVRKRILLVAVGLVMSLLMAEAVLRILRISFPVFYTYDERGGALLPGAKGWWTKEGLSYVVINSDGNRDVEHSIEKPADVFRIAVLGDSYAEALAVDLTNAFWWVMGSELNRQGGLDGKTVEVLNFGVSGYGTGRELLTLRSKAWKYKPDLVLLAFLTGNDISDNYPPLKMDSSLPYFVLKEGELVLDESYLSDRAYMFYSSVYAKRLQSLINNSYLLQLVNEVRNRRKARAAVKAPNVKPAAHALPTHAPEPGLSDSIYRAPVGEDWQQAWILTEAIMLQMSREVQAERSKFLVATLSNGIEVAPNPEARQASTAALGVPDLLYADKRIASFCVSNDIAVVNLAVPLARYAEEKDVYIHGFPNTQMGSGHWNEAGHRVAGGVLANVVQRLIQGGTTGGAE